MAHTIEEYKELFTKFYETLVDHHPEIFCDGGRKRIGSTFKIKGSGGLDAQTFYMRPVLEMFLEQDVVIDIISVARAVMFERTIPTGVIERLKTRTDLNEVMFNATEAGTALTASIGPWSEGTDLFANIMVNADSSLQMAGIYDHINYAETTQSKKASDVSAVMDQAAIDALFG
jgi:hypothetical protein